MRKILVLLFIYLLTNSFLFAKENINPWLKKITVNFENAEFEDVISEIEKVVGYKINYNKSQLQINKKITLHAQNQTVNDALTQILKLTGTTLITVNGNQFAIIPAHKSTGTIKGKVVDKIGYKTPIYFTLLFSSTMLVLMVVVDALPGLIVIYTLYAASSLTSYLGVNTGTTRESKLTQRGMALGALGFYVSFSRSISTLSLTPVWNNFGINAVFITTAIIVSIATITIFLVYKILGNRNDNKKNMVSTDNSEGAT